MKIGIRFGDNDYQREFVAVLKIFQNYYEKHLDLPYSKSDLVKIINELSTGIFLMETRRRFAEESEKIEFYRSYIKLSEKDVFLNEEVDNFIANNPYGWNHDFHFLDTDLIGYENNSPIMTY